MPGAFLHKKSLLDQFGDDYKMANPIKARRTERQWENPIVRHKREKGIQDWAKSFAGKRHYRKLTRFNAMRNESAELSVFDIVEAIGNADIATRSDARPFNIDIDDKEYAVDVWLESKETGEDYLNPSWRVLIAQKFIGTYKTEETGDADVIEKTAYDDAKDIEAFFTKAFNEAAGVKGEAHEVKTAWSYLEELGKLEGEESRLEAAEKILKALGCNPGTEGRWYDKDGDEIDIIDVLDNTEWAFAQKVCGQLQESRQAKKIYPKFVQINTQRDFDKYIKPALGKGADAYGLSDVEGMWWEIADGEKVSASAKTMREIRDSVSKRPRFIFISGVGAERGITDMSLTEYAEEMGMTVKEYLDGYDAGSWESKKSEDSLDDFDNRRRVSPSSKYITFSGLARGDVRDDVRRVLSKSGILDPWLGKPDDSVGFGFGVRNNPRSVRKALAALLELGERNTWYIKYNDGDLERNRITMYSPDIPNDVWYAGDVDKIVSYIMPVKSEAVDETLSSKKSEGATDIPKFVQINTQQDFNEYARPYIRNPGKHNWTEAEGMWWELLSFSGDEMPATAKTMREIQAIDEDPQFAKLDRVGPGDSYDVKIVGKPAKEYAGSLLKYYLGEEEPEEPRKRREAPKSYPGGVYTVAYIDDRVNNPGEVDVYKPVARDLLGLFKHICRLAGYGSYEIKRELEDRTGLSSGEDVTANDVENLLQDLNCGIVRVKGPGIDWSFGDRYDDILDAKSESLSYEKGNKNSRGEDAPWVIRDHKGGKVLASFAKKVDAEAHLERMQHYSKGESLKKRLHESRVKKLESMGKASEGLTSRDVQAAVSSAWSSSNVKDFKLNIEQLDDVVRIRAMGPKGEDNIGIWWVVSLPSLSVDQYAEWGAKPYEQEPERTYDAKDLDDLEKFFQDEFEALQETLDVSKENL